MTMKCSFIRKIQNNHQGSLLIEVLLSLVILSVSVSLIIQSMTASIRASRYTSQYFSALNYVENSLFTLITDKHIDAELSRGLASSFFEEDRKFKESVGKKTSPDQDHVDLIKVTVSWESGKHEKKLTAETLIIEKKLENE